MRLSLDIDKTIEIKNIVFDFNGTIAEDGNLIDGIREKIAELSSKDVNIFILTGDTYGTVSEQCANLSVIIEKFNVRNVSDEKKRIIKRLGSDVTVAIGNGRNDLEMFKNSILSIAVIGKEGCFTKTVLEADLVVKDIMDAIDILLNEKRLKATMRT